MITIDDVNVALYSILSADATLTALLGSPTGIYDGMAPDGAIHPIVVFTQPYPIKSMDMQVMPGSYLSVYKYDIKSVASGTNSGGVASQISKRIFQLLQNATLPLPEGSTFYCRRSGEFAYPEDVDNTRFSHVGGTYQIEIAP